jgi:hypothetical protein
MLSMPTDGASACKLTPSAVGAILCDYHSPPATVTFSVAIYKGKGSVAFAAFYLDGQQQTITPPNVTAALANGRHKLLFVLAFSDPTATAVIREACNPPQDLVLIDANDPQETLRVCVP